MERHEREKENKHAWASLKDGCVGEGATAASVQRLTKAIGKEVSVIALECIGTGNREQHM